MPNRIGKKNTNYIHGQSEYAKGVNMDKIQAGWTFQNWSCYKNGKYQQGIKFVPSYLQRTCEYGFPDLCDERSVLLIPWGFHGFPGELNCCEKHIGEMTSPFVVWAYQQHIKELPNMIKEETWIAS